MLNRIGGIVGYVVHRLFYFGMNIFLFTTRKA